MVNPVDLPKALDNPFACTTVSMIEATKPITGIRRDKYINSNHGDKLEILNKITKL